MYKAKCPPAFRGGGLNFWKYLQNTCLISANVFSWKTTGAASELKHDSEQVYGQVGCDLNAQDAHL